MRLNFDFSFRQIKLVRLNKDRPPIGEIAVWEKANPKLVYLSWRKNYPNYSDEKGHYFVKLRGFGIDSALLKDLIVKYKVEQIIIQYRGPQGKKYFVSNVDDWIMKGVDISYTKDRERGPVETYGKQKVLCEDHMEKFQFFQKMLELWW